MSVVFFVVSSCVTVTIPYNIICQVLTVVLDVESPELECAGGESLIHFEVRGKVNSDLFSPAALMLSGATITVVDAQSGSKTDIRMTESTTLAASAPVVPEVGVVVRREDVGVAFADDDDNNDAAGATGDNDSGGDSADAAAEGDADGDGQVLVSVRFVVRRCVTCCAQLPRHASVPRSLSRCAGFAEVFAVAALLMLLVSRWVCDACAVRCGAVPTLN